MQLASIISDLNSLRVCDLAAAQNLVSARPTPAATQIGSAESKDIKEQDPDLQRAKDVMDMHFNVKIKHGGGMESDAELATSRKRVEGILHQMNRLLEE